MEMKFKYFLVVLLSILNVNNVNSLAEDVVQLREHFITNLIEEHRENLHQKLTDEIQQSINARIETFMGMLNEPQVRRRREADNLHLNEEGMLNFIPKFVLYCFKFNVFTNPRVSFEPKQLFLHVR